jgi:hypothetical protein
MRKAFLVLVIMALFTVAPWACQVSFAGEIVAWGVTFGAPPAGDDFIAISGGYDHCLAIRSDGSLAAFGRNFNGQCSAPTGNDFIVVSAGHYFSVALRSDGSLIAWGDNGYGQHNVPTGNNFVDIAAGAFHSLALTGSGSIEGWGWGGRGQLNIPGGSNFVAIASGTWHSVALRSDGSLVRWGYYDYGVPSGNDFVAIAAGAFFDIALKFDGSLVAWGNNDFGQCNVPAGNDFVAIDAGLYHGLALRSNGSIEAWGWNPNGQLNVPTAYDFVAIAGGGHLSLALTPAPPVADADGPYSIFVGDTLTLDASGSTGADNDIVSYMWDLNDDETFETDAGAQPILVVDYPYLQSLGLLINYTYTIHLKVTDSEGQSDVNDSTLIIVPKPATVAVDIKPGSCPNPVNVKSSGVLPIAILGTDDCDITTIDPTSVRLAGVEPLRSGYEDVATPVSDTNDCNCITDGPDGLLDLTLKFKTQRIVEAIGDVNDGDVRVLTLTGVLFDPGPFQTSIEGADCILIRGKAKSLHGADINKDGVVDMADFAIFAQNWLQSGIVDE